MDETIKEVEKNMAELKAKVDELVEKTKGDECQCHPHDKAYFGCRCRITSSEA